MVGALTDTLSQQILGKVEYTLRDYAHRLVVEVHQVTLNGAQKKIRRSQPGVPALHR